jgi:hypothetical protein
VPRSDAALDVYDDDLKFTQDQIDDARCLIVYEYSEMVQERRAPVYGSLADAIRMAASELSAMRMLSAAWPTSRCRRDRVRGARTRQRVVLRQLRVCASGPCAVDRLPLPARLSLHGLFECSASGASATLRLAPSR